MVGVHCQTIQLKRLSLLGSISLATGLSDKTMVKLSAKLSLCWRRLKQLGSQTVPFSISRCGINPILHYVDILFSLLSGDITEHILAPLVGMYILTEDKRLKGVLKRLGST